MRPLQSLPLIAAAHQPLTARLHICRPLPSNLQSNIHTAVCVLVQGSENLKAFDQYMRDTTLKLNRKVEDLEDVRFLMGVLKEVRASAVSVYAAAWPAACVRQLEMLGKRTHSGPQLCSGLPSNGRSVQCDRFQYQLVHCSSSPAFSHTTLHAWLKQPPALL